MKIDPSKRYHTRNGGTVGPFVANRGRNHDAMPWVPVYDQRASNAYTEEGRYYLDANRQHALDAVSEIPEPPLPPLAPAAFAFADEYDTAARDALNEVRRARELWPNKAGSAHEQFAVTDEELDELMEAAGIERMQALIDSRNRLWGHVKVNQKRRNLPEMRKEAIQVAAMALRFAAECCGEESGRK